MILIYTKCYTKDIYFVDVAALKMHVKIDVMAHFLYSLLHDCHNYIV